MREDAIDAVSPGSALRTVVLAEDPVPWLWCLRESRVRVYNGYGDTAPPIV